jgi:hypothetical protein
LTPRHKHDGSRSNRTKWNGSLFFHAVDRDVRGQLHDLLEGA